MSPRHVSAATLAPDDSDLDSTITRGAAPAVAPEDAALRPPVSKSDEHRIATRVWVRAQGSGETLGSGFKFVVSLNSANSSVSHVWPHVAPMVKTSEPDNLEEVPNPVVAHEIVFDFFTGRFAPVVCVRQVNDALAGEGARRAAAVAGEGAAAAVEAVRQMNDAPAGEEAGRAAAGAGEGAAAEVAAVRQMSGALVDAEAVHAAAVAGEGAAAAVVGAGEDAGAVDVDADEGAAAVDVADGTAAPETSHPPLQINSLERLTCDSPFCENCYEQLPAVAPAEVSLAVAPPFCFPRTLAAQFCPAPTPLVDSDHSELPQAQYLSNDGPCACSDLPFVQTYRKNDNGSRRSVHDPPDPPPFELDSDLVSSPHGAFANQDPVASDRTFGEFPTRSANEGSALRHCEPRELGSWFFGTPSAIGRVCQASERISVACDLVLSEAEDDLLRECLLREALALLQSIINEAPNENSSFPKKDSLKTNPGKSPGCGPTNFELSPTKMKFNLCAKPDTSELEREPSSPGTEMKNEDLRSATPSTDALRTLLLPPTPGCGSSSTPSSLSLAHAIPLRQATANTGRDFGLGPSAHDTAPCCDNLPVILPDEPPHGTPDVNHAGSIALSKDRAEVSKTLAPPGTSNMTRDSLSMKLKESGAPSNFPPESYGNYNIFSTYMDHPCLSRVQV